jgi:cellulose synthase/poly-beta-1,6-N-acetylglucosamine synthase-like glycosyltransferase
MRLGREIVESDSGDAATVCVVNEAFVKRFFDRRNPVGMRIAAIGDDRRTTYRVVGVAGNARTASLRGVVEPRYFVAAAQPPASATSPTFLIRTATEGARA